MERFWSKVDKTDECWNYTGCKNPKGYGEFRYQGTKRYAHRVAFHLEHGRWPDDCLLHKCDNPRCVRPDHMFEGSRGDNNRDMWNKGRYSTTHNPSGPDHPKAVSTNSAEILRMREIGMTYKKISLATGHPHGTIGRVIKGEHWSCR